VISLKSLVSLLKGQEETREPNDDRQVIIEKFSNLSTTLYHIHTLSIRLKYSHCLAGPIARGFMPQKVGKARAALTGE
jgi:hypothetical protein